ncbi:hypothetical protein EDB83DRAFT_2314557 [Lactarius deliciosus]|nr:hypothetical protein EDB83DRAFT_2314557 [Lactarius deliciosus]
MSPISVITPTTFHIEKDEFRDIVGYFDVFFDNVGDKMLDFTLTRLNKRARITFCGATSQYSMPIAALTNLSKWISEGRIIRKFHVVERLEKADESLPLLFSGGNIG